MCSLFTFCICAEKEEEGEDGEAGPAAPVKLSEKIMEPSRVPGRRHGPAQEGDYKHKDRQKARWCGVSYCLLVTGASDWMCLFCYRSNHGRKDRAAQKQSRALPGIPQ